jgi:ABC-2 type transport system permease protein
MTITATPPRPPRAKALPTPTPATVFLAAARAERTKMRSVRSTMWSLLITFVLTVGLGALICLARVSRWDHLDPSEQLHFDATAFSLTGLYFSQLAVGVLGVLIMSSEYATGQIRATLGAVPQRRTVLAAKVAVFGAVVFVVGLVSCFVAFSIGQAIFSAKSAQASLGDPGVLRAVVGGALYLAVLGALGIGLATIIRRTAGAIAALVGLLLIVPIFVNFLPSPWNNDVSRYLPSQAGSAIFQVIHDSSNSLSAWTGFAVFCAYAVVAIVLGAVRLTRSDA